MNVASSVDFGDIQGIIRFGHLHMTEACYFLVRVRSAAAARAWLASAPVTAAVKLAKRPSRALQIALTRPGLEALGVPAGVIRGFSAEFIAGMAADENRSRRLGDVDRNSPSTWGWGRGDRLPHAVVMVFADEGGLDSWKVSVRGPLWKDAFEEITCLSTSDMKGREHFGFIDGISQPWIDWDQTRTAPINGYQRTYSNLACLGEFLLGYRNEYGQYTERPLLDPQEPGSSELPFAEDQPEKRDLGRNGTYLVMRQLAQDVRGFWQFLDRATISNPAERNKLGSSMVGRMVSDGSPLVPLSPAAIPGIADGAGTPPNRFTYDSDAEGVGCPYGAHIRRANPRTADIPGDPEGLISTLVHTLGFGNRNLRDDLIASARFHRILRRGREYGPSLTPEEALGPAPQSDPERGLHFVAINGSIQRQFEFIQNAWIMRTKFNGLTEESDPLLGNRAALRGCRFTDTFSIPQRDTVPRRIMDLPQFITVRGGAYFFLPGMRALRYLSGLA